MIEDGPPNVNHDCAAGGNEITVVYIIRFHRMRDSSQRPNRVQAQRFPDDCSDVWQGSLVGRFRQSIAKHTVELGLCILLNRWPQHHRQHERHQSARSSVRAGEICDGARGLDVVLIEAGVRLEAVQGILHHARQRPSRAQIVLGACVWRFQHCRGMWTLLVRLRGPCPKDRHPRWDAAQ